MCKRAQVTLQKKQKLPTGQIHRKHPKSVGKLIVYKFTDEFLSSLVITDEFLNSYVITNGLRINSSVNPSINLATDDICR